VSLQARKTPLKRTAIKRKKTNATTKADVLFSRLVRDRDHACVNCGITNGLQCAHVWSRRYYSLRWKFENAVTLCSGPGTTGCHFKYTLSPAAWAEWCEERVFSASGAYTEHGSHLSPGEFTYHDLRMRALYDPPEKAVDALARLKSTP
jgi:hypothetical protein